MRTCVFLFECFQPPSVNTTPTEDTQQQQQRLPSHSHLPGTRARWPAPNTALPCWPGEPLQSCFDQSRVKRRSLKRRRVLVLLCSFFLHLTFPSWSCEPPASLPTREIPILKRRLNCQLWSDAARIPKKKNNHDKSVLENCRGWLRMLAVFCLKGMNIYPLNSWTEVMLSVQSGDVNWCGPCTETEFHPSIRFTALIWFCFAEWGEMARTHLSNPAYFSLPRTINKHHVT